MDVTQKRKNFFDIFPVPEVMLLSTSGISISDQGLKFFQFRRGIFGRSLPPAYLSVDLPEGTIKAGEIQNQATLTSVLKDLSSKHGIRYVHATLPEEKAYLFTSYIPKGPTSGLRDAVAFILEENVPLTLADAVFDYETVRSEDPGFIKVTVTVLPKVVVDSYIKAFEDAGITPVSFTLESQAVARAVVVRGEPMTQLVINLERERAGFYVVEDEVVQFSAIQSQSDIGELKSELKKVLAYWDTQVNKEEHQEKKIEKVLMAGSRSRDGEVAYAMTKESGLACTAADVWVNLPADHMKVSKELYENSSDYAAAIGLSLPGLV